MEAYFKVAGVGMCSSNTLWQPTLFLCCKHDPRSYLLGMLRFGPLDLLEDLTAPLLLEQQQHNLAWTPAAQVLLQQREADAAFQQAAHAALSAAQSVSGEGLVQRLRAPLQ